MDRRQADQREPALDQILLDDVDERAQVEDDLPVAGADRAAALPGQHLHHLLVGDGVDLIQTLANCGLVTILCTWVE